MESVRRKHNCKIEKWQDFGLLHEITILVGGEIEFTQNKGEEMHNTKLWLASLVTSS